MKKIFITAPIHNREKYLPLYLDSIISIDYPKELIKIFFIVNNTTDESMNILKQFKHEYRDLYASIIIKEENSSIKFSDERTTSVREKHTYNWLSWLRNQIIKQFNKSECDYILSIDSDIIVPKDIITKLMSYDKDVVSSLIYNGYLFDEKNFYKYPNIMKRLPNGKYIPIVNSYVSNPKNAPYEKLIKCDLTGAVFLGKKDAVKDSAYGYSVQGEDAIWSESVIKNGFELYCSPSCYSQHLMSEDFLQRYINGEYLGR